MTSNEVVRERSVPPYLSSSAMETFEQCPKRYEFSRIERLPDPGGLEAVRGSFVHLVLEQLFSTPRRDRERARALCSEIWESFQTGEDYVRLDLDEASRVRFKAVAWEGVVGCLEMEDAEGVEVVATEQRLEASLGGTPVVGVIDRVDRVDEDNSLEIVDYKTGKVPTRRYAAQKLRQGHLYAALYEAAGLVRPARLRMLFVTHRESLVAEVTDASIAAAVARVRDRRDEIDEAFASDHFPAQRGPLCNWCTFRPICPAFAGS
jgi:putative RecB family exonuclease